jgi:hypothetical protein
MRLQSRSVSVTAGLKWAPEMDPNVRISANSPAPVAVEFSNSSRPALPGDSRCAAIPDPTTIASSSAVPMASAVSSRAS